MLDQLREHGSEILSRADAGPVARTRCGQSSFTIVSPGKTACKSRFWPFSIQIVLASTMHYHADLEWVRTAFRNFSRTVVIEDDGTKLQVLKTTLRLNLRTEIAGAQSEEGEITFSGRIHWYFPADDAVDLAILPIAPDETKYDYARVPVSMFATPEVIESTRIRRRQQQT